MYIGVILQTLLNLYIDFTDFTDFTDISNSKILHRSVINIYYILLYIIYIKNI
jgi:hypothetical protein